MTADRDGPKRPGRLLITLPEDLQYAVKKAAFAGNRPVNAEINMRLRETFPDPIPGPGDPWMDRPAPSGDVGTDEQALLKAFRKLSPELRAALLALARAAG